MNGLSSLDAPPAKREFSSRRPGIAPFLACRTFWTLSGGLAPRRTGEKFARARTKAPSRRSMPRRGRNRKRIRRRKAERLRSICSGRAFAFLRRADPPTGLFARPFLPRLGAGASPQWRRVPNPLGAARLLSAKSLNPLSHGAPPEAWARARNPVGRHRPRRREREGDPGLWPRHARKSSQWPTR